MPLARRTEQVRAPDEHVARPVGLVVRVLAGHGDSAVLQGIRDEVLRLLARCGCLSGKLQRVGLELRRGRQPAHPFGADVVVDHRAFPRPPLGRGGRKDVLHLHGLVAPLVGMRIEERGGVHVARRTVPVQREGKRGPAGLRAQLFLSHIMAPAAARLADAAAHHQHVDDAAIVHVHVVPVVETGTENDHGTAIGLFGIGCKFAGDGNDLVARDARDLLRPGRCIGQALVIGPGGVLVAKPAIEAVIGGEQVEHGRDQHFALLQLELAGRDLAHQHAVMVGAFKIIVLAIAEIRERHIGDGIVRARRNETLGEFHILTPAILFFKVPLAVIAPAEADGALRGNIGTRSRIKGDRLPVGIVGLAQIVLQVRGAQEAVRHVASVLLREHDQHREVGIFAAIILEIGNLPVEMVFAQDHMAKRHGKGGVGALLRVQPEVGELCGFRIVGRDHDRLGALVAHFRIEMRIRRAGLRHVGTPEHQEARIVPVCRFRHVGLFAPCHG